MTNILLTSKSELKQNTVKLIFSDDIITLHVSGGVEQPFGPSAGFKRVALECAYNRINKAIKNTKKIKDFKYIVALENGIIACPNYPGTYFDICDAVIYDIESQTYYTTINMPFDSMIKIPIPGIEDDKDIWDVYNKEETIGYQIAKKYEIYNTDKQTLNHNNWMQHFGTNRIRQMYVSLYYLYTIMKNNLHSIISSNVIITNNFPEMGVMFKDYQKVFGNINLSKQIAGYFCRNIYIYSKGYIVAGPELRGYMGIHIAELLDCHHTMIRKSSNGIIKMAGDVVIEPISEKEYDNGKESFYCLRETFKNKKVILFDDILATGGSIMACCKLIEKCGGHVVKLCFMTDVVEQKNKAQKNLEHNYQKVDIVYENH